MKVENSIRKQKLTVHLASESDAMLLRARLPDINRTRLLPIIERVLEEMSVPDQRISIDQLTIDLGTMPFNDFADEAELRLDALLRNRLQDIVTEAKNNLAATKSENHIVSEPAQQSRLRQLEYYLINGVLPWHAHNKSSFSCEALFLALAEEQKDSVVDLIVKHYRLPQVIERLVLQLGDESLRKLLLLLEPHNAEVILAYILDLGVTHTLNPVLPINASNFQRLVWLLTLTYSLRERGTQFNRRSYLKSLIQGMAQSEGLKYRELVMALHQGLKKIIKNRPLKSTLPALIATLIEEKNVADLHRSATVKDTVMLLRTLIKDYPADTRHFLLDIQAKPELANKAINPFLEKISSNEYEQVLRLAQPDIFNLSKTLAELLASIPVPYRPGKRKLRSVILAEVLLFEHATAEDFFTRILRALFPTPLSRPLAENLFASAESWLRHDGLTEEQVSEFKTAINHCLSSDLSEQTKNRHTTAADELEDSLVEWQNRVFSTLLPAQILRLSKYAELKNLASISREKLPRAINQLLVRSPDNFSLFVREHIVHQPVREYWIDILPESSLVRFIWLLEPQQLRALLNSAETLASTHFEKTRGRGEGRRDLWLFLLDFFAGHSGSNCTLSAMNSAFFDHFTSEQKISNSATEPKEDQVLTALDNNRQALLAEKEEQKIMRPTTPTRPKSKDKKGSTSIEDSLYINNAGLALIGVFLPHLFKSLDMLHTNAQGKIRLRDKATFSRAVHMLQYLVNGSTSSPEPLLVLNKILCGESIHATIERSIELTEEELRMCDQLHKAVLANWTSLSNTSINGLQETFLQREGRLVQMDDGWKLTVQRKTVDVLMDQVSWSISVISHAWMPEKLYVTW